MHNLGCTLDDLMSLARELVARGNVETDNGDLHIRGEKSAKTLEVTFVGSVRPQIANVDFLGGMTMLSHFSRKTDP
jgi:hypothetical protein